MFQCHRDFSENISKEFLTSTAKVCLNVPFHDALAQSTGFIGSCTGALDDIRLRATCMEIALLSESGEEKDEYTWTLQKLFFHLFPLS